MERIHYAGDSILTGSDIARALLDYAGALAAAEGSETVDIPCRHDDGTLGRANFLVGPASQLVSETEESEFDEVVEADLVAMFRERTAVLRGANVVRPAEPEAYPSDFEDL